MVSSVNRIAVNRLATEVKQGNRPGFMPGSDSAELHLATVYAVDPGRNEIAVTLNEYGNPVKRGIPVRQSGGRVDLPAVGDVVQLEYVNNTLQMVGRQFRPTGAVVFG